VIKKDPRFVGTRNASSEFGRAGAGSKVLRQALQSMLGIRTGKALNNRLTSALLNVIQADPLNKKGKREVLSGDLNALRGFEFKPNSPLFGCR
jgi:hypothetical protein